MVKVFFLDKFYADESGRRVVLNLSKKLEQLVSGKNILVIGFKGEILDLLDNGRMYFAVPKMHKAARWPNIRPFKTVIVDETTLPFAPRTFDVIIINHCVEFSNENQRFLKELFRILKQDGKLVAIVLSKRRYSFCATRSLNEVICDIEELFNVMNIFGIKKNSSVLPCNFDCNLNKYNKVFIEFFSLLSDILVITADKSDVVSESIQVFKEQYEMT